MTTKKLKKEFYLIYKPLKAHWTHHYLIDVQKYFSWKQHGNNFKTKYYDNYGYRGEPQ